MDHIRAEQAAEGANGDTEMDERAENKTEMTDEQTRPS
jgi:hypothetical protein